MSQDPTDALEQSWIANADGWTRAVREGRIESRRVATDSAILEAILECSPRSVLDIGCGEGWLTRALTERGVQALGIDASAPLIDAARAQGGGSYCLRSYAELTTDPASVGKSFDAAVFNFALLDEDGAAVLQAVREILAPTATLFIQTVHPWTACGDAPYHDAWRTETFAGFGSDFREPMPWYFRTLESWISLLLQSRYRITDLREPKHPETGQPLSLLFAATPSA